jgi:hypothetical protein
MRTRLRPKYSEEELKEIYKTPHEHNLWVDHIQRVESTIALSVWFYPICKVADLSCGDGYIVDSINAETKYKGDFASGYDYTGPIEKTLKLIPVVDLFILSETIEHIDDPDTLLREIRKKTKYLILTTPKDEHDDSNPEHYWGWGKKDMKEMLISANFSPQIYQELEFFGSQFCYTYQMWGCS